MILSTTLIFALLLCGIVAGLMGALVGIGGGIIVVPTLVLGFGIDIKTAVACSLVAVVASSTAAGSVYVGKGLTNMRLGMLLEVATTLGGLSGGYIALLVSPTVVSGMFSILMIITCVLVLKAQDQGKKLGTEPAQASVTATEDVGALSGTYYDPYHKSLISYQVKNLSIGGGVSFIAGILSGMLGVGGGFLKVPAMTLGMKVPMKVASATSNFTIGVTAVASLFIYFSKGFVAPMIAAPVAVGVVAGAFYGTSLAQKVSPTVLRKIFAALLVIAAIQMFLKSLGVAVGK